MLEGMKIATREYIEISKMKFNDKFGFKSPCDYHLIEHAAIDIYL